MQPGWWLYWLAGGAFYFLLFRGIVRWWGRLLDWIEDRLRR